MCSFEEFSFPFRRFFFFAKIYSSQGHREQLFSHRPQQSERQQKPVTRAVLLFAFSRFQDTDLQQPGPPRKCRSASSPLCENTIYLHYYPEQDRIVRLAPGNVVKGIILMVEPDFFNDIINRYTDRAFGLSDLRSGSFICDNSAGGITTIVDQVMNCSLTGKDSLIRDYFNGKTKELMMLFINALVCQHDSGAALPGTYTNRNSVRNGLVKADDYEHIQALIQYMQSNLSEEISLDDLSSRSLMSRRKLTSSFKLVTGLTIQEYHSLLRLRRAQVLLRDTVTSIGDIAIKLGFSGPSSFSNFFRRQTGITPSEFRKGYL